MLRWSLFKSPQSNNIFVLFYCILLWNLSTITYALRCKCTTSKGATRCDGDFCDVHALNGKRGACGMVRFERETHFACVRINASSNDTYCHVVKGATACWCRDRDFCNVDIELDLEKQQRQSSVDEEMDEDDDVDGENWADDQVFMGGVQVAEDVAGDPFVIEATQIDGMAAVEYQPAERVDEVKKIRVSPEAKTTPPLLPIIQYIDNFGDDDDGYDSEDWDDENENGDRYVDDDSDDNVETKSKPISTSDLSGRSEMQIEWKNTGKDTTKGTLDWSSNSQLKSEFDHQMMGISTRLNQTKVEKTPWNVARVGHPMMLNSTALTVTDERQSALETIAPTTTPMPPAILRSSSLSVGSTVSFDWPSSSPSKIMTNIDSESSTERQTLHPWLATTAGLNWPSTTPVAAMRTPPSAITTDEKMDRAVVLATTTTEPSSTSTLRTTTTTTTRKTVPSTPPQTTTTPTITTPTTSTPPPPPTTTTTITATTTTMRPPTTPSSPSLSSSSATTTKTTPTTSTTANTPQIWNTPVVSTQLPSAKYTPSVVPMVMITERRTTFETKSSSDKNAAAAMTTKVLSPYLRPFRPLSVKVYSQTAHGSLAGGLSESAQTLSMSQLKARRMSASENSMDAKRSDDQSNKGQTLNYGDAPILEGADLTGAKGFESEVFQETAALLSQPISTKITTTFPKSESIPSELISAKFTSSGLLAAPQRTLHRSINGFSAPDDDVASGVLSVAHSSSPTTATVINSEIRGDQQAIAVKSRKTSPTRIIYQSVPRTSWSIGGGGKKVGWQRSTSYSQPSLYFLSWFTLLHLVFSSQLILK